MKVVIKELRKTGVSRMVWWQAVDRSKENANAFGSQLAKFNTNGHQRLAER